MSIFYTYDNLPADYKPNNMFRCHLPRKIDIMTGETARHTFEVPFNVEDNCQLVEIIYKLGIEPVIIKNNLIYLETFVNEDGKTSTVICTLKPSETLLFKNTVLDVDVQLKFYMRDGSVVYSEIYPITVREALDTNNRTEPSSRSMIAGIGGYGYTED